MTDAQATRQFAALLMAVAFCGSVCAISAWFGARFAVFNLLEEIKHHRRKQVAEVCNAFRLSASEYSDDSPLGRGVVAGGRGSSPDARRSI